MVWFNHQIKIYYYSLFFFKGRLHQYKNIVFQQCPEITANTTGLMSIRHNSLCQSKRSYSYFILFATEPELQPVSQEEFMLSAANVQDSARLDIVMNCFQFGGRRLERALIDVHVFTNPFAPSNACLLAMRSMRTSRKELMDKESKKVSMHASCTPVIMLAAAW